MKNLLTRACLLTFVLGASTPAAAVVVFEDSFDTHSTANFGFSGQNVATWAAAGGKLQTALTQTAHNGTSPGFAAIVGQVTSQHFKLEADVQGVGEQPSTNYGHVGFFWGFQSPAATSLGYLRTHADQVTTFQFPFSTELLTNLQFNAVNAADVSGTSYHLAIEVDYLTATMTVSLDNASATYTGAAFYQANSAAGVGGGLGLISWGERVSYDNIRLTDYTVPAVPEAGTGALMLAGLLAVSAVSTRRGRHGTVAA